MALRVGLVGMRGIGNTHAQAHTHDPLSKLVAVCDVVEERADDAAKKYGVPAYYSLRDMLRNEDLDVVDVTTGGTRTAVGTSIPQWRRWRQASMSWSRNRSQMISVRRARWCRRRSRTTSIWDAT